MGSRVPKFPVQVWGTLAFVAGTVSKKSQALLMNNRTLDRPKALDGLPPDFLLDVVALIQCMRLSSRKGAHVVLSSAAWQEIRVARLFRPTLAGANMGHPSSARRPVLFIAP
jgi:hypothetical protein